MYLGDADRRARWPGATNDNEIVGANFQTRARDDLLRAQPTSVLEMHLADERLCLAAITGIGQLRQCERGRAEIFAVKVNLRWRIDLRARHFKRKQCEKRLRFVPKLKCTTFWYALSNRDGVRGERRAHGPKALRVLCRRMQRRPRRERLGDHMPIFI